MDNLDKQKLLNSVIDNLEKIQLDVLYRLNFLKEIKLNFNDKIIKNIVKDFLINQFKDLDIEITEKENDLIIRKV